MMFAAFLTTTPARRRSRSLVPRSAGTIENYVATVRAHLAALGGFPLTSGLPRWKRFVRGLRRIYGGERRLSRGVRAAHLRRAFAGAAESADPALANAWALATFGWQSLARPRELGEGLSRADLSFADTPEPHAVVMLFPRKKKPGQSKVPVVVAAGDGSGADGYAALCNLVRCDPCPPAAARSTPLFRRPDGRHFSPTDVSNLVKRIALAAGESASGFGGRALRVGGATDLHALGVPATTIQLMGRWSSDVYRVYTRVCLGQLLRASRGMHAAGGESLEERFPGYVQSASLPRACA